MGQSLQVSRDGSRRQIQTMGTQVVELLGGWPSVVVLVEQNLQPNGDAKTTVRQHARSNRGGDDAWVARARAKAAIASSANAAAIGFDVDFDDVGVFLVAARREGLATTRALCPPGRQDAF